ncbi:major facilitator superfamily domain-containing protein, partial [Hysterangium stoloniferum]
IDSIRSVTSWRKIFLVEGIITISIGILCVFYIPNRPENFWLLTEDERILVEETATNSNLIDALSYRRINPRLILRSFTFHAGICALGFGIANISLQGFVIFLPTIIASPTVEAQLRTVPPQLVQGACAVGNAYVIPATTTRNFYCYRGHRVTIVGYGILVVSRLNHPRYGACFLAFGGTASTVPFFLSWAVENSAPEPVRGANIAIVAGAGGIGSLISVWAYLPSDAPKYRHGFSLNLAWACISFILAIIGVLYVHWENAKRERGERDDRLIGKSQTELDELGSQHPEYRFQ